MTESSCTDCVPESHDEWMDVAVFASYEDAAQLLALLSENSITYNTLVDKHSPGDGLNLDLENRGPEMVHVQVLPQDADRAQRALAVLAGEVQSAMEEGDYLAGFSDEELFEVLHKFDEWNQIDYVLAARLLTERGHALDDNQLKEWRAQRMHVLEQPEKASAGYLVAAYVLSFLGGIFGLLMGLQLRTHVKRLPDGRKVHGYTESDRKHGLVQIAISLLAIAVVAMLIMQLRR